MAAMSDRDVKAVTYLRSQGRGRMLNFSCRIVPEATNWARSHTAKLFLLRSWRNRDAQRVSHSQGKRRARNMPPPKTSSAHFSPDLLATISDTIAAAKKQRVAGMKNSGLIDTSPNVNAKA